MKYAENLDEVLNAFVLKELNEETIPLFHCETIPVRMDRPEASHLEDIYESCLTPSGDNTFLFLGHRGCGKSTELNRLKQRLEAAGHCVSVISCALETDLSKVSYSDLLILMADALLDMAARLECKLPDALLNNIEDFWKQETIAQIDVSNAQIAAEGGARIETPGLLGKILNLFAGIKGEIKYNTETRREIRETVDSRLKDWNRYIRTVADLVASCHDNRQPVLIFEELDKLAPESRAMDIFSQYAEPLSDWSFPVIYTFPIAQYYDPKFAMLEGRFQIKCLPMIKLKTIDSQPYPPGKAIVLEIVKKRARPELFDPAALDLIIEKSGGSLRDVFTMIIAAARLARRRKTGMIELGDAEWAITELRAFRTRFIESRSYELLQQIYDGNHTQITDRAHLLEMMQVQAVLEYNGKRWHDVHPLVADFLRDEGLVR